MYKLNIGCGILRYEGEIGVDKFKTSECDVVAEMHYLPYPDNSCDFVRLDHVLEHIPFRKCVVNLLEIYRVLCTGGTIRVGVPDLFETCKGYIEATTIGNKYEFIRNLYGSQAHDGEYHQSGWDTETLYSLLHGVGFKDIVIEPDLARTEGICIFATATK